MLNARRHHDEKEVRIANLDPGTVRVLNARRHHDEKEGLLSVDAGVSRLKCLTPEGITTRKS